MRVEVTFKNNDKEKELYEFLKSKGEIVGKSAYIKQLLLEQLKKKIIINNLEVDYVTSKQKL